MKSPRRTPIQMAIFYGDTETISKEVNEFLETPLGNDGTVPSPFYPQPLWITQSETNNGVTIAIFYES